MKKRKEDLIKPTGSHPGETKAGIPPEHFDTAIDVQLQPELQCW